MRKISFYPRLALANLLRNRKTYFPYLLACVTSIFTFYTLLTINTNGSLRELPNAAIVQSFSAIGTIIMAFFCTALIFYTNSFLIKRRKNELGLYAILGMEKGNIGAVLFFETLFVALFALLLGFGAGMLFSRLLFLLLLRLSHFDVNISMPVSPSAMGVTAAFFAFIFLLTLLTNLRQVRRANPIDLMAGAKQGEKEPKASWLLTLLGVVCLAAGYVFALRVKSPMEALMMFLVAVCLVIIGTFCLFTSGSIALLKLLRRNKKYYYSPKHFVPVSGMLYRMKQNAAGLASICILCCMVLVTVLSTVALYAGAEDALLNQYPHPYEISASTAQDADWVMQRAEAAAQTNGIAIQNLKRYQYYPLYAKEEQGQFTSAEDFELDDLGASYYFSLLTLSDYNRIEGTGTALAPGEALLFCTGWAYTQPTLTLNGTPYSVTLLETLDGVQANTPTLEGAQYTLVLPDDAMAPAIAADVAARPEAVLPAALPIAITFGVEGTPEAEQAFISDFYIFRTNETPSGEFVRMRSREEARAQWYATYGGFLFLGIFFGVLFLLATALIIYYKQLSEGYDDRERYEILQKVGMSGDEVRRTIGSQILAVFFLPLLVAVVHIAVALVPIRQVLHTFGIFNTGLLLLVAAATVLVFGLVYLFIFRRTAKTYYQIVRRAA